MSGWETPCPVRVDGAHCRHWYDGDDCCACGPATGPAGALIYSRARGYVDATPGLVCVLRAAGQTLRVRVTGVPRPGRVAFRWVDDLPPRLSGWERWRRPVARAGRLQVVDF